MIGSKNRNHTWTREVTFRFRSPAEDIMMKGSVPAPASAKELLATLNTKSPKTSLGNNGGRVPISTAAATFVQANGFKME
jgi:hypothetical protein